MDVISEWINQAVRKAVSCLPYAGRYQYSVVSCNTSAQTISARSLSPAMPDLTDIPMATPGLFLDVPTGTLVTIGFRSMSPTRPYVESYGSGGSSTVLNVVACGWIGLAQAVPPASTLTVTYVPAGTLPAPVPELLPNVPTPLSPVPVYFPLLGVVTDGD